MGGDTGRVVRNLSGGVRATRPGWMLAVAALASIMISLDLLIVATSLLTIRVELGAAQDQLFWVATAYAIPFASLLLVGARLGDRFGPRRMLVTGLLGFAGASLLCGLAPNLAFLVGARAVQGSFGALVIPLAISLLVESVGPMRTTRTLGFLEALTGVATVAGPVLGGIVTTGLGWRWVFWLNLPIAVVTVVICLLAVRADGPGRREPIDLRGALLAATSAALIVLAVATGPIRGPLDPLVLVSGVVGIVLGVLFVRHLRRTPNGLIPRVLLRDRQFTRALLTTLALFASLYGSVYFLAQYFQVLYTTDAAGAGLRLLPWTATLFVVAPLAGLVAERVGERPVLLGGLILQALGMGLLAVNAGSTDYAAALVPLVIAGVGASAAIPVVQALVLGAAQPVTLAAASGANSSAQELGGALGVAVLVGVLGLTGGAATEGVVVDGMRWVFLGSAVLAVIALAVAPWKRRQA